MRRRTLPIAWLYTGPLGHLYGTAADVIELWGRWGIARTKKALPRKRL
jgi:hypothetical protein